MKQAFSEIEDSYRTPDPWGFKTNPDDRRRKMRIQAAVKPYAPFERALDIGAGEGWITADLPAKELHGYEVSDQAASRFPKTVTRVQAPSGKYDLVTATGVLYQHYEFEKFLDMIWASASKMVVLCNISTWEVPINIPAGFEQLRFEKFPYREFEQVLRLIRAKV